MKRNKSLVERRQRAAEIAGDRLRLTGALMEKERFCMAQVRGNKELTPLERCAYLVTAAAWQFIALWAHDKGLGLAAPPGVVPHESEAKEDATQGQEAEPHLHGGDEAHDGD